MARVECESEAGIFQISRARQSSAPVGSLVAAIHEAGLPRSAQAPSAAALALASARNAQATAARLTPTAVEFGRRGWMKATNSFSLALASAAEQVAAVRNPREREGGPGRGGAGPEATRRQRKQLKEAAAGRAEQNR